LGGKEERPPANRQVGIKGAGRRDRQRESFSDQITEGLRYFSNQGIRGKMSSRESGWLISTWMAAKRLAKN